jgi:hypothetical protein
MGEQEEVAEVLWGDALAVVLELDDEAAILPQPGGHVQARRMGAALE